MNKHTPGPWKYAANSELYAVVGKTGNVVIAFEPDQYGYGNEEEVTANSRLIAAAPELLEILEALIEKHPGAIPLKYREQAKAAIAKATGEQIPTP
jgi:hypothetical protein